MKTFVAVSKTLIFALSFSLVSIAIAASPSPAPGAKANEKKVTPAPTPTPNPDDATLPGTVIARKNGGFISVTLETGDFKMNFFDAKKLPIAPDVARATARWKPKQKFGEDRSTLNPTADQQALKGNHFVQPPFPIRVTFTLLNEAGAAAEIYSVNFKP